MNGEIGEILTPDCPMCGTPMPDLMGLPVLVPLCVNEECPVISWAPELTIAQNMKTAQFVDDPFTDGTKK